MYITAKNILSKVKLDSYDTIKRLEIKAFELNINMDYSKLAAEESVARTAEALGKKGIEAIVVNAGAEALQKIKELIPKGASVMVGSSRTLEQIGFVEYLQSGNHGWNNLKAGILAEKDPAKRDLLRKQSVICDYYLGSLHALSETGEFVVASASGSQLPYLVYTSPNIILVSSTKKIVPSVAEAFNRVEKYVFPLEDQRMKASGAAGSNMAKEVLFREEPSWSGRKFRIILVKEDLGF